MIDKESSRMRAFLLVRIIEDFQYFRYSINTE